MLYKVIDSTSPNCGTSALNIFETRPTQVCINNSLYHEILTLNPLDSSPFHFNISASNAYLDLSRCYLKTQFKLQKYDTATKTYVNIEDTDLVSPNQALGACWMKNIRCLINQREVYNGNMMQAYRSFMALELSHTVAYKKSVLQSAGYYPDDALPTVTSGKGFIARRKPFLSGPVEYISRLAIDIFDQELLMLNQLSIDLEILPHEQNFNLVIGDNKTYKLTIEACKLYVKTIELMDGLNLELAAKLENNVARYGIQKTEMKSLFITEGRQSFVANIFQDQVPKRITVALTKFSSFNGTKGESAFTFANHSVRNISVQYNNRYYPNIPYKLDFKTHNYVRAFHDMNESLGFTNSTESNGIDLEAFKTRSCFFVFNMTNAQEITPAFDLIRNGTTSVEVNFDDPVPAGGLAMIIFAEFDQMILIDSARCISTDASV